jgi:hypothetical protein
MLERQGGCCKREASCRRAVSSFGRVEFRGGVEREVIKVEVRRVDTQIKRSALLSKVRESPETRPRARREEKMEEKREEGDGVNASQHGGAVKRSKSKVGRDAKAGKGTDEITRRKEERKRWYIAY